MNIIYKSLTTVEKSDYLKITILFLFCQTIHAYRNVNIDIIDRNICNAVNFAVDYQCSVKSIP
jgi:hypothetical protein